MAQGNTCPMCGTQLGDEVDVCPNDGTVLKGADRTLAPRDPLIGIEVGGYRIDELIGTGGLGLVYRGEQAAIGKPVAIKVLRWEFASAPQQVRRLVTEAKAVNAIRHRGIIDIFSMGQLPDGRHYLVMELLEGDPLDKVIGERAPMEPLEVADILDELLDALGAAHRAGVVHRDLKPSNIFMVKPPYGAPYLKLLDFGLAKQTELQANALLQTRASVVVGTPLYMAPEQARGELVSPRTDLYALGVILFEMLTGRPPFVASNVFETISQHLKAPIPLPSAVAGQSVGAFDELVTHLMSKDPNDRPASAVHVREAARMVSARLRGIKPPERAEMYVGFEDTLRSGSGTRLRHVWRALSGKSKKGSRLPVVLKTGGLLLGAALIGGGAVVASQLWWSPATAGKEAPPAVVAEPEPKVVPVPEPQPPAQAQANPPSADQPPAVAEPVAPPQDVRPEPTSVVTVTPPIQEQPLRPPKQSRPTRADPRPAKLTDGTLKLHVFPWADIYVDGTLREKGVMDFEAKLSPGRHALRLVNPSLEPQTETVSIVGGQTLEKRIRLKRKDGP